MAGKPCAPLSLPGDYAELERSSGKSQYVCYNLSQFSVNHDSYHVRLAVFKLLDAWAAGSWFRAVSDPILGSEQTLGRV